MSGKYNPTTLQDYIEAARIYDKLDSFAKAKVDRFIKQAGLDARKVEKAKDER